MIILSELLASKPVKKVIYEYKNSEDSMPLFERKDALDSYMDTVEQVTLTDLQECFVSDLQEAVNSRNDSELKRLSEYGNAVFTVDDLVALKTRALLPMTTDDFNWHYATFNNILKQEALAKGRLDIVASLLEQETKPSRASELEVIENELVDLYDSCCSLWDEVMVFNKRLYEVRDAVLTQHERDFLLTFLDAVEKRDMARLDTAMLMGQIAAPNDDERRCLYGIAAFFLQLWQLRWVNKAMGRLLEWDAAGRDMSKPPKRVNVTKKMLEGC